MSAYLKSPCCGARVLGMVDITLHPRFRVDGSAGPIVDTYAAIKYEVAGLAPNPNEAYCEECGDAVDVARSGERG